MDMHLMYLVAEKGLTGELYTRSVLTYGRVDESKEYDGADNGPDGLYCALLETLRHHLVETMAHASKLRRESVTTREWGQWVNIGTSN